MGWISLKIFLKCGPLKANDRGKSHSFHKILLQKNYQMLKIHKPHFQLPPLLVHECIQLVKYGEKHPHVSSLLYIMDLVW